MQARQTGLSAHATKKTVTSAAGCSWRLLPLSLARRGRAPDRRQACQNHKAAFAANAVACFAAFAGLCGLRMVQHRMRYFRRVAGALPHALLPRSVDHPVGLADWPLRSAWKNYPFATVYARMSPAMSATMLQGATKGTSQMHSGRVLHKRTRGDEQLGQLSAWCGLDPPIFLHVLDQDGLSLAHDTIFRNRAVVSRCSEAPNSTQALALSHESRAEIVVGPAV
mmetsp:Transcript_46180/g.108135  ORF Transcript_46180/g.108135 Transcript_46180/m.108135 type:complete len:224 (+) Transcript_46180:159-830(+)